MKGKTALTSVLIVMIVLGTPVVSLLIMKALAQPAPASASQSEFDFRLLHGVTVYSIKPLKWTVDELPPISLDQPAGEEPKAPSYEVNVLWSRIDGPRKTYFFEIVGEGGVTYTLAHVLNQSEYLITVITHLLPSGDSGDFVAFNTVQYVPKGEESIQLGDIVMINVTTTLPEMYSTLSKVLSRFAAQSYDTTQDETLIRLGNEYHRTAAELEVLSAIAEDIPFDAVASSITLVVDDWFKCNVCRLICKAGSYVACAAACLVYLPSCAICVALIRYAYVLDLGCAVACVLVKWCP